MTTATVATGRVSVEGNAIGRVRPSVCPSVSTVALNQLTIDLDFLHVYGSCEWPAGD